MKKKLTKLGVLVAAGGLTGLTALTVQAYRHPLETTAALARAAMLLVCAREGICDAAGLPMHYYYAGRRGTPLVFIHGLGGSAENWLFLLPLLSKEYLVYALDLPGFGRTPLALEGTNIATHALYVQRFLDALGYPRATLVGNSLGGWIATRFAVDNPERVRHLYLLNSAGLSREGAYSPYTPDRASARHAIQTFAGRSLLVIPNVMLDAMVENSQRPAYKGFIERYDKREELDAVLDQVRVPTTIIWGTDDRILPLVCAQDFHKGIADSRLILLPGVGHTPQTDAAATVARIILQDA